MSNSLSILESREIKLLITLSEVLLTKEPLTLHPNIDNVVNGLHDGLTQHGEAQEPQHYLAQSICQLEKYLYIISVSFYAHKYAYVSIIKLHRMSLTLL